MKIVFMGTPAAAVPSLAAIVEAGHEVVAVYTQPDRRAGRGKKLTSPPVKVYAAEAGIPVFQPTRIKTNEAAELFRSHGADAAVVVAYGKILPKTFLEAYPRGCMNVHFSLLPKYRGAAPVNWAIVHGEKKTGVTTMLMDEGLDTGDILLKRSTKIGKKETADELTGRLAHMGAELIVKTLASLGKIKPKKQDESKATHAPMIDKGDGRIDWSNSARRIERRVRGFQPFPKSYSASEHGRLTFWECKALNKQKTKLKPGTVISASGSDLRIACGKGTVLKVIEVQQEGKRKMPVSDFLNGTKLQRGERLGVDADE